MALTDKLSAIGEAIREKTGKSELLTLNAMPEEIRSIEGSGGGGDLPAEAFYLTGNCDSMFHNKQWSWFIENYGDRITTENISIASNMFDECNNYKYLPFSINISPDSLYCDYVFENCKMLREVEINGSGDDLKVTLNIRNLFNGCYSLREVNGDFFSKLPCGNAGTYGLHSVFLDCFSLDEIVGLPFRYSSSSLNYSYNNAFKNCSRLKRLTFKPYTFTAVNSYKGITIDLTQYVGYVNGANATAANFFNASETITKDKLIDSDEKLAALYDDPNCWTKNVIYSRYNHDSAVETINSLPDVVAAASGGVSTIKFKGDSGSATPAGGINTMTEEEIAVATAKGWTVTMS